MTKSQSNITWSDTKVFNGKTDQVRYSEARVGILVVSVSLETDEKDLRGWHVCWAPAYNYEMTVWGGEIFSDINAAKAYATDPARIERMVKRFTPKKRRTPRRKGAGISYSIYD